MFIWDKKDLNDEQGEAILEDGNVLLVACPGSGKTRTLIYKIGYEISKLQSSKKFVVAITYTNTAADEIKDRIELLGVDISQLWVGTIHAFCLDWILRPYSLYLDPLKNGFSIINAHDSEEIITDICKRYRKYRVTYWDCGYFFNSQGVNLTCSDSAKHNIIHEILNEYFQIVDANNQIDFEQILYYSYQLLASKPVIGELLSKIFPFILIDEYQDTKEIQYQIILSIIRHGQGDSKLLIVGDPNQSIYENLGGYPMEKTELEKLGNTHLVVRNLSANYRSSEKIINYFDFFKTHPSAISPEGENSEYPSAITYNQTIDKDELIDEIERLIRHNINEKSIATNEICIAAPQWYPLAALTRSLMVRMPDYSFNGPGMAPFSRDIDNFWYLLSKIILTEPSPSLYIRRLRWSKEVLDSLKNNGANVSSFSSKKLLKICNSLDIEEENGLEYLKMAFRDVLNLLGVNIESSKTLNEHYVSFFESSSKRIEKLEEDGNEYVGTIDNFKKVFKQRDGITISTIHGTKGEEYDTVIGFGLVSDWVPHFSDRNGEVNSKKMLYVLSSRARKNLHLISERGRSVHHYYAPYGKPPTPELLKHTHIYDSL